MKADPTCPRCGTVVKAPGLWSSGWTCPEHGGVAPFHTVTALSHDVLQVLAKESAVPLWVPWPPPPGWMLSGAAHAGDDRTGARATVMACSGPAPLGGLGELLIVAEEPGVGLGAHLSGLDGPDPGDLPTDRRPDAKVHAAGHPTPLWNLPAPEGRAVFVGEAEACWLWLVLWPEAAGHLLAETLELVDLRDSGHDLDLPIGARSPRLAG